MCEEEAKTNTLLGGLKMEINWKSHVRTSKSVQMQGEDDFIGKETSELTRHFYSPSGAEENVTL